MKISSTTLYLLTTAMTVLLACGKEENNDSLSNEKPVPVTLSGAILESSSSIQASGKLKPAETAVISTRVMGFVTGVHVKEGDPVQKGQLLISLNGSDIQAKRAQAEAMVTDAEAALQDAQKDFKRFEELYNQQSASEKEFENARLHYASVKAKAEAARQMKNEVEAMLAYTNIRSPFSGTVGNRNVDVGSMANPGVPLLVIESAGDLQAEVSVTEQDIAKVKVGAPARITIKSTDRVIEGKVSVVSPSSQFNGGQYLVKIDIPVSEKKDLYSGAYVNVVIDSSSGSDDQRVLVPSSAILYRDQLTGLFTVSEHQTALLRWVKLGKEYGDAVEVLSGLSPEEKFILEVEGKLYNGIPVTVR